MTKEALKLALEALEAAYARIVTKCEQNLVTYNGVDVDTLTLSQEAITAIKEALAQPEQEPVAWMNDSTPSGIFARHMEGAKNFGCTIPLYTTPPHRKPLTDKQILADETLRYYFGLNGGAGPVSKQGRKIVNAIEALHNIKETEK